MQYLIPDDYDSFRCLADRCPDTCCRGWRISIDDASLKKYTKLPGPIGNRLRNSVDWHNGVFRLYEGGCALLGDEGLCDLQLEAGEEALCDTCRLYPRHEEEYDHVRERSLSLSCPEAAEMAVSREAPLTFKEWETEEEDDFDEFDGALFLQLQELRGRMIRMAQERSLSLPERIRQIILLGRQAQAALEEGRLEEDRLEGDCPEGDCQEEGRLEEDCQDEGHLEDCQEESRLERDQLRRIVKAGERNRAVDMDGLTPLLQRASGSLRDGLSLLRELPGRDERWRKMLDHAWEQLSLSEDGIRQLAVDWMGKYAAAGEQLLVQFLYVYLCGAVYDRQIAAKSSLAAFSVCWIFLIGAGNALAEPGQDEKKLLTEVTWRLARLIEHDDENLALLEAEADRFICRCCSCK